MRKLFALITATVLALLVYFGFQNVSFDFDMTKINALMSKIKNRTSDESPAPVVEEEEPVVIEENLTYDERVEKGTYYLERGFLTLSASEFAKAAQLEPKRLDPHLQLMQINFDLLEYEKARLNAEAVLKLQPNNLEANLKLIQVAIRQSRFDDANVLTDTLVATYPEEANLLYYKGLISILKDSTEEGQAFLEEAKAAGVSQPYAGYIDTLLSAFNEFTFAQGGEPLYLGNLLARAFNQIGEYEIAIYKLKDILKTRVDLRDSWVMLGFAYLNLQKNYFALTAFEKAYEIDPEHATTQYFLGLTYNELEQKEDAIIYLNYALNNGFSPEIILQQQLADLYLDTQSYELAVDAYEGILEVNSGDVNAFVKPIWINLDFLSRPIEAQKLAEDAVQKFPDNAMAYNLLGWAQTGTENYTEAEKSLLKALEIDPNLAAAQFNLGKLYEAQGKNAEALAAYQAAYDLDQTGSIGNLAAERYNTLFNQ